MEAMPEPHCQSKCIMHVTAMPRDGNYRLPDAMALVNLLHITQHMLPSMYLKPSEPKPLLMQVIGRTIDPGVSNLPTHDRQVQARCCSEQRLKEGVQGGDMHGSVREVGLCDIEDIEHLRAAESLLVLEKRCPMNQQKRSASVCIAISRGTGLLQAGLHAIIHNVHKVCRHHLLLKSFISGSFISG